MAESIWPHVRSAPKMIAAMPEWKREACRAQLGVVYPADPSAPIERPLSREAAVAAKARLEKWLLKERQRSQALRESRDRLADRVAELEDELQAYRGRA